MTKEEIWRANGEQLGYPTCCIDAFVERGKIIIATNQPVRLDDNQESIQRENTGFIPCPACAAKVVAGLPLGDLITNRDERLPEFPNS